MYAVSDILDKLNQGTDENEGLRDKPLSMADIITYSRPELHRLAGGILRWGETQFLYKQAQQEIKENKILESRIFSRSNPQLARAVHLGIRALPETRDYNDMFGNRASKFVRPGSVASMFSPAGYLTELYREGNKLHNGNSLNDINKRRPDLAALVLNQQNQDEEISTLALSNELLIPLCQKAVPETDVMETLASHRLSSGTPYHAPYETVHHAITLQDETLSALEAAPAVVKRASPAYLAALKADISPELHDLLTEDIPEDADESTLSALWQKNFGDMPVEMLGSLRALAGYYDVSEEVLTTLLGAREVKNITGSMYTNNQYVSWGMTSSGKANVRIITRKELLSEGDHHFKYLEIIPTGSENSFITNIHYEKFTTPTVKAEPGLDIYAGGKNVYHDPNLIPEAKNYNFPVTLSDDILKDDFTFEIRRYLSYPDDVILIATLQYIFSVKTVPSQQFLLNANKIIRLYKAAGLPPEVIRLVVASRGDTFSVDAQTLSTLFFVTQAMQAYGIDAEQALVFTHAGISQFSMNGSVPLFDRLFNTPLLNNQTFAAEGQALNLTPGSAVTDTFSLNALKRGLQVNDNELLLLWQMASKTPASQFTCTPANVSSLYLVRLLAQVHGLSVNELAVLKSVSSLRDVPLESLTTADALGAMVSYIRASCRWLKAQNWSVTRLFLMTTRTYSTSLTPDIESLLTTLRSGLDSTLSGSELESSAVPLIAATVQLGSNEAAASLLRWLNMLKPAGLTSAAFLTLVLQSSQTETDNSNIVVFCQVLAQLSLCVRALALSDGELHHLTLTPGLLDRTYTSLPHDAVTLQLLTRFHAFINRCGTQADDVLTGLSQKDMTPDVLADILGYDLAAVRQALQLVSPDDAVIADFATIDNMMQWLSVAATLCVTPDCVSTLLALDYTTGTDDTATTWPAWLKISQMMAAGLKPRQSQQLQNTLDESLSTALSKYYLTVEGGNGVNSRDTLYQYLLIDGQVSAQVKTTRLAEAIASLQLYINQALNEPDDDVVTDALSGQFFKDWDTYNKRYSTWAGVSQLAYYPENYIDPSVRIGQTKMMDTLLQSISQSSINQDTVEDAFKTYLTDFEQVANLDVISGYHDNTSVDTGLTYFIGRNEAQQTEYYWRSADHSKMQDGVMAANAWTEWNKINLGISPYLDLIQPVIFNSRLYLCWIERTEKAEQKETATTATASYTLKLSHIRYDNSWSTPAGFDVTGDMKDLTSPALYVANNNAKQELIVGIHEKKDSYPDQMPSYIAYHSISSNMLLWNPAEAAEIYTHSKKQYDTLSGRIVKNAYAVKYTFPQKVTSSTVLVNHKDIDTTNSSVVDINLSNMTDDAVDVKFKTNFLLRVSDTLSLPPSIAEAIQSMYTEGDVLYTYQNTFWITGVCDGYIVINKSTNQMGVVVLDLSGYNLQTAAKIFVEKIIFDGPDGHIFTYNAGEEDKLHDHVQIFDLRPSQVDSLISYNDQCKISANAFGFNEDATNIDKPNYIGGMYILNGKYQFKSSIVSAGSSIKDLIIDINDTPIKYTSWTASSTNLVINPGKNEFTSKDLTEKLTSSDFSGGINETNITLKVLNGQNETLASRKFVIQTRMVSSASTQIITLNTNAKQAQYMTVSGHKVRLNTLFAKKLVERANTGIDTILTMETQQLPEPALDSGAADVPMDFAGANALYFWELFYYTPMLIARRFLQEQRFTEATRWLKYVFSPAGYIVHGAHVTRNWNVRPLLDDTSWNDNPLDSVDPDAVAQNDPMHYKVATFMHALDQLIARGDSAYRLLERDTLGEAKMWYFQALTLLGEESETDYTTDWAAPRLDEAASETTLRDRHAALTALRDGQSSGDVRTASSLLDLFLPQVNDRLLGYRTTLRQRLYNLRHNLSIDGQPLSLPVYAAAADPAALLSAAAAASQGGGALPAAIMPVYRFPVMMESARSMVSQLTQFGSLLLSVAERQDGEAMAELLQNQGQEVALQVIAQQNQAIAEIEADQRVLEETRNGAQSRLDSYRTLYDGDVSSGEKQAMDLYLAASVMSATATTSYTIAAGMDSVPNIYGMAMGGSRYGAIAKAVGLGIEVAAGSTRIAADKLSQSEAYRRRREEWEIQRNAAESDVKQIDAQLASLSIRHEAAVLQKSLLETQQGHTQAQLAFLQTKFTRQALYNWLRGKLAAIYYQFYDLTVSRCLMAQEACKWELSDKALSFIKPGAWQGAYAGLLAGESLMLSLAQMEQAYLKKDERALEVTRTVSLADVYRNLSSDAFDLHTEVSGLLASGKGSAGNAGNTLSLESGKLEAGVQLAGLSINTDYPAELGSVRRIRQISVTLPALVGPYEDVRAVLNYGGSTVMPRGCKAIAISHGMNDSGQFVLDFSDPRYLPFEGIPVTDSGALTLTFPEATSAQKTLLESLSDIILHIRYTIRS